MEPGCLFRESHVKRAGLLASVEPVAFQEDGLGGEPGAAGRRPGLGRITRLGLPRVPLTTSRAWRGRLERSQEQRAQPGSPKQAVGQGPHCLL